MDHAEERRRLRAALLEAEPWLGATDVGPQAVDAGPCDRCQDHPRIVPTCGPTLWRGLCRDCATTVGTAAWCDGHQAEGQAALAWVAQLPDHWGTAVTLWWIATGEVLPASASDAERTTTLPGMNGVAKVVARKQLHEPSRDATYWRGRPASERLELVDQLRCRYHGWSDGSRPELPRVHNVARRA
jgi:hypothetical protein